MPVGATPSGSLPTAYAPPAAVAASLPEALSVEDALRVFRRRWPIMAIIAVVLALVAYGISIKQPKQYQATAEVLVQPPVTATEGYGSAAAVAALFSTGGSSDLATQVELMQGDQPMTDVMHRLHLDSTPVEMRTHYEIAPSKTASNILMITARDDTATGAANLVSTLVAVYQDMMGREDSTTVGRTGLFLKQRIRLARRQMDDASARLARYQHGNATIDPSTDGTQYAGQLFGLKTTLAGLQREMQVSKTSLDLYQKRYAALPATQVSSISFEKNPRIEADRSKISGLVQERATLAKEYTPQDEAMKQNQAQIDSAKDDMAYEITQPGFPSDDLGSLTERGHNPTDKYILGSGARNLNPYREASKQSVLGLQATLTADKTEANALADNIAQVRKTVAAAPEQIRTFAGLTADAQLYRSIYQELQVEAAHLQTRRGAEQVYAKIIQPPLVPDEPFKPKPLLYSALALFLGLLLGSIAMFLVDNLDPQLRDAADVRRALRAPVLARIRRLRGTRSNPAVLNELAGPAFRRLAYTLAFRGVGKDVRSLLVTSATPGEGTTFTASQLALAYAREGKRVIIVDANVRNPALHVLFGAENNEGWAGLTRNGSKPENALVPVAKDKPLRLIPSGSAAEHGLGAGDVLPDKIAQLIERLQSEADIVLVDAPAVFDGLDTSVLADKVEGILFVAGVGRVTRAEVEQATELLGNCRAPILGAVVNASLD